MDKSATQNSFRRAWIDTEQFRHSAKAFWGIEVVGAAVFGAIGVLGTPSGASKAEQAVYPAIGIIFGFVLVFGLVFLWNLFRAPYRQRDEARAALQVLGDQDEVAQVITALRSYDVIYGEANNKMQIGLDQVFVSIGDRLAQGLRAGFWSTDIFDTAIGKGWTNDSIESAFKGLLLQGLVTSDRIEPAKADAAGRYQSIHAMPYTIYTLTESGRKVYLRLADARKSMLRKGGYPT